MDEKKIILKLVYDFNILSELAAIHELHRSESNIIDGLSLELTGRLAQVSEYLKEMVKLTPRATIIYRTYTFSCSTSIDGEIANAKVRESEANDSAKRFEVRYKAVKVIFNDRNA